MNRGTIMMRAVTVTGVTIGAMSGAMTGAMTDMMTGATTESMAIIAGMVTVDMNLISNKAGSDIDRKAQYRCIEKETQNGMGKDRFSHLSRHNNDIGSL